MLFEFVLYVMWGYFRYIDNRDDHQHIDVCTIIPFCCAFNLV